MCARPNVLPCYLNVCLCVGVHAVADRRRPASQHARVCVCVCESALGEQCVCSPARGLRSNKKAQERQAAGFQFGAVNC